jgi:anti-anti-sigma factor
MEIAVTSYKRCEVVKAYGFLEGSRADELENILNSLLTSGKYNLVLDMSEVTLLPSKAIKVLIHTQKECKRLHRGEIVLTCLSNRINNALSLVGMEEYFKSYPTVLDAVGHF